MEGLMKKAKLKAIMDIISEMDDMELEKMMPKSEDMKSEDMKPEGKGITIMKIQSSKTPEIEMEDDSEGEDGMEEDDFEEIDPYSTLGRLIAKLKGKS